MNFVGGSLKLKGLAPKPITQLSSKSKDIKKDKKKKDKKEHKSNKAEIKLADREETKDTNQDNYK